MEWVIKKIIFNCKWKLCSTYISFLKPNVIFSRGLNGERQRFLSLRQIQPCNCETVRHPCLRKFLHGDFTLSIWGLFFLQVIVQSLMFQELAYRKIFVDFISCWYCVHCCMRLEESFQSDLLRWCTLLSIQVFGTSENVFQVYVHMHWNHVNI